jgi:hypothetical protein
MKSGNWLQYFSLPDDQKTCIFFLHTTILCFHSLKGITTEFVII